MIEVFVTEEFQNRYQDLPKPILRKAEKREEIFRQNPFHPSPNPTK